MYFCVGMMFYSLKVDWYIKGTLLPKKASHSVFLWQCSFFSTQKMDNTGCPKMRAFCLHIVILTMVARACGGVRLCDEMNILILNSLLPQLVLIPRVKADMPCIAVYPTIQATCHLPAGSAGSCVFITECPTVKGLIGQNHYNFY